MRNLDVILNEIHEQATKDNCQSWNVICQLAMEQAIKEKCLEISQELEILMNNCDITSGYVNIPKDDLNNFIDKLTY